MMWLTWRQHRGEAFVVGGVLAPLAVFLVVTGRNMAETFQQLGVGTCLASPASNANCDAITSGFQDQFGFVIGAVAWLNVIPVLLGILVGAPLVARELEAGTHRLVWTQGITRWRWLTVKLMLIFGGALVASAALTALLTWWFGPLHQFGAGYFPITFDFEGTVLFAYVAFALALAITMGTLLRRTIVAMLATVGGFLVVRLPIEFWLRPHYLPPITHTWDPSQTDFAVSMHDWQIAQGWVDAGGHTLNDNVVLSTCATSTAGGNAFNQCIHSHGWLAYVTYQPADRFLLFRVIETGIYFALAVALLALAIWWVRRRIV